MSYVGQSIERLEDLRLLRGRGKYVDDLHRDGMVHAAILRSSVPHGRIRNINTGKARAMPGVRAVYTGEDIAPGNAKVPAIPVRLMPVDQLLPFEQPCMAKKKVRYVGEPIAIVVADTLAQAEDALDAIEADIEPLAPVPDRETAVKNSSLLIEEAGTNIPISYIAAKGDALSVKAPYVRRERLSTNRHSAVCLEPRGLLATWDGAKTKLTVEGAAKVPFQSRKVIAKNMDLPEDCIDMIEGDVGGGFGVRGEFHPEDFLIPWTARKLGRPVKWVEDRRENLLAANHSREIEAELEIACEKDGTVLALRGHIWVNMGAYARANGTMVPRNCAQMMSGPYRIPNLHIESTMFLSNKTPVGTYRGPGRFEADFFRERMFDLAARELGVDPVEFRRKNLARKDEFPFPLATLNLPEKKEELDSGNYEIALDRCIKEFGWEGKKKLQGKLVDGRYHGIALTCFIEGGAAGPRESARMVLDADGGVSVFVGGTSIGQGLETVMVQIAADALGLPMDKLRIFHGSTTAVKEGFGSFHSRSTVMSGTAVLMAAKELKDEIGKRLGHDVGSLKNVDLKALAPISVETTFHNHRHTYASGTAAAHVAVDPRTGHVRVIDYVTVEDIGKIVNPLLANGQIVGAAVQGLGGTLLEHFQYDENGQFLTGSLADYLLPTSTDFPSVRAFVLEDVPSPVNPLGAKGAGEGGIVAVGGVVANAVAAALAPLGAVPRVLPLTPSRVWEIIQAAR
ncbi:MAG TPA: xanthine dehydrogenase family protein molybdopterin-binding subunit [Burkholderiales bacterium]|jgi:carbon-monoxide dehydrogenase large subunit|nr:xanthine dehydrogenase family protein molybdopterin-binding subunit [Burkholderiales bacterium]